MIGHGALGTDHMDGDGRRHDDPRGLREDLRAHVPPIAVGFVLALTVQITE
jgi:hypothetical protein